MGGNQKERALALLAGLGFGFAQIATNTDYRSYTSSLIPTDSDALRIALGTFVYVTPLLLCALGMWSAYQALESAGVEGEDKIYKAHMRAGLRQAALVIGLVVCAAALNMFAGVGARPPAA